MDRRVDLALSIFIVALGVFVIVVATDIRMGLAKDPIGPRTFFYGVGILFVVGGAVLTGRLMRTWSSYGGNEIPSEGTADESGYPASALRAGALIAICLAYAALLEPLGYLVATPLFIAGGMLVLGVQRWLIIVAISLTFTIVAYLVFAQFLNVRMPVGPFTDLFRELGWIVL